MLMVMLMFPISRKNPGVWETWHPGRGNARHSLLLAIARRGVELLAEGGLFAYSSCALNQVENEAVVAALLAEAGGGLELVDMEGSLEGLKWLPGLSSWRPHDKDMKEYTCFEEVSLYTYTHVIGRSDCTPH